MPRETRRDRTKSVVPRESASLGSDEKRATAPRSANGYPRRTRGSAGGPRGSVFESVLHAVPWNRAQGIIGTHRVVSADGRSGRADEGTQTYQTARFHRLTAAFDLRSDWARVRFTSHMRSALDNTVVPIGGKVARIRTQRTSTRCTNMNFHTRKRKKDSRTRTRKKDSRTHIRNKDSRSRRMKPR
jgi:hypothetical protein